MTFTTSSASAGARDRLTGVRAGSVNIVTASAKKGPHQGCWEHQNTRRLETKPSPEQVKP